MNERIRELAEQVVIAVDNPFPGNPLNDELEKMYIPDCFAEKFAELIVRECANLPFKSTGEMTTIGEIAVSEMILKHFGVEE